MYSYVITSLPVPQATPSDQPISKSSLFAAIPLLYLCLCNSFLLENCHSLAIPGLLLRLPLKNNATDNILLNIAMLPTPSTASLNAAAYLLIQPTNT